MLHAFAEESRVSRDNQHMKIEQKTEASTSTMLADGSATRDQMRDKPAAFDLVLTDINMPILDGHEATVQIRQSDIVCQSLP